MLPFLTTEGSRVLMKKVNETQVSKTVFSHLNISVLNVNTVNKTTTGTFKKGFPGWSWKVVSAVALVLTSSPVELYQ